MLCASAGQDELPNSIWMWLMFFNALILSPVAFAYGEWEVGTVLAIVFALVIGFGGIEITAEEIGECCTTCGSAIWLYLVDCFWGCVDPFTARNDNAKGSDGFKAVVLVASTDPSKVVVLAHPTAPTALIMV